MKKTRENGRYVCMGETSRTKAACMRAGAWLLKGWMTDFGETGSTFWSPVQDVYDDVVAGSNYMLTPFRCTLEREGGGGEGDAAGTWIMVSSRIPEV